MHVDAKKPSNRQSSPIKLSSPMVIRENMLESQASDNENGLEPRSSSLSNIDVKKLSGQGVENRRVTAQFPRGQKPPPVDVRSVQDSSSLEDRGISPHFQRQNSDEPEAMTYHEGTLDGDTILDNEPSSHGQGFKYAGTRYLKPPNLRSFTTNQDDQEDYFVGKTQGLGLGDNQESSQHMQQSRDMSGTVGSPIQSSGGGVLAASRADDASSANSIQQASSLQNRMQGFLIGPVARKALKDSFARNRAKMRTDLPTFKSILQDQMHLSKTNTQQNTSSRESKAMLSQDSRYHPSLEELKRNRGSVDSKKGSVKTVKGLNQGLLDTSQTSEDYGQFILRNDPYSGQRMQQEANRQSISMRVMKRSRTDQQSVNLSQVNEPTVIDSSDQSVMAVPKPIVGSSPANRDQHLLRHP